MIACYHFIDRNQTATRDVIALVMLCMTANVWSQTTTTTTTTTPNGLTTTPNGLTTTLGSTTKAASASTPPSVTTTRSSSTNVWIAALPFPIISGLLVSLLVIVSNY
ncbi:unnamed protein product [Rotaria magnacalcarata]|uniref:Uncharacterized protein n=1 Tax=Rotaria magnacalcarata TaxID=392030 RepID=A0A815ZM56_9BILA|nr:unnamed protein product [Rotaria magnacalcarata]CAF1584606.1 unnamed protein product [Rotaria magnacalcarata]